MIKIKDFYHENFVNIILKLHFFFYYNDGFFKSQFQSYLSDFLFLPALICRFISIPAIKSSF